MRGMNSTKHLAFERFLGSGDESLALTMLDGLSQCKPLQMALETLSYFTCWQKLLQ